MRSRLFLGLVIGCVSNLLLAQGSPSDKVFLKDGQILSGRLIDSSFKFNTIYGSVTVPNEACRSLERKGEAIEILSTVNKETITGYLADPAVAIQLSGGPRVEVQKELIQRLVFASRAKPIATAKDYFQMKNGDSFYGTVLDQGFDFTTSYGTLSTSFATLLKLEDIAGQTNMYLSDGSTVMGYISTNVISARTNYGFDLKIPKSSIRLVQMRIK